MWTRFKDMHSGGGAKEKWESIHIEAPEAEAKTIFYNRFGHNPDRVTCTCCGNDYSISEDATIEEQTAFSRGCRYAYFDADGKEVPEGIAWVAGRGTLPGVIAKYVEEQSTDHIFSYKYQSICQYTARPDVLIIKASEIKPEERFGEVPIQGYVYVE